MRYDPSLASFLLASDQGQNQHASLVFEFVVYSKNSHARDPAARNSKDN